MSRDLVVYMLCLLLQLPMLVLLLAVVLELKLKINYERLKLPKDVFLVHLKLSIPSRIAMSVLVSAFLAFLVCGGVVIWHKLQGGRVSPEFLKAITTGSTLPFVATAYIVNRILKIRLAYRYVNKKFSNWIFLDALILPVVFQVCFWFAFFNIRVMRTSVW